MPRFKHQITPHPARQYVYQGVSGSLPELARTYAPHISLSVIKKRIARGLDITEALEMPLSQPKGKTPKIYEFRGVSGTLKDIHAAFNWRMGLNALRFRLRNGMTLEEAFDYPAYEYQRQAGKESAKHLDRWRKTQQHATVKPPKPRHPEEIIKKYMGQCVTCGALVLRQSLNDGGCCS
jgi:hypothetical protein